MRFRLTDDQRALKSATRELLDRLRPPKALRADASGGAPRLDRVMWAALAEAGVFALRLPEDAGGVGLGAPEAVLVFEELGRALAPGPLVATHLAAGRVPGAATGETVVTRADGGLVAWLDEADVVDGGPAGPAESPAPGPGGRTAPGAGGLSGGPWGGPASGPGAQGAVPLRSVDPLTPLHRVPGPAADGPWDPAAALLTAAEQLGTAGRVTELAVRYAREREQFGRPVGSFQAVKHLCAGMLVRTELARAAVYAAAVTGDPAETAGAKLLADEAAVANARDCVQIHGGMGFTWEADVHLHLKRAWVRARSRPTADEAAETAALALAESAGESTGPPVPNQAL
ncbi:acyl-CoA dehydrogenase family protein [Streptomyces qinzhouensis]|uniref:Acyl-CoA dehydrogenase n=1 Tax=Streptomyces qinzhouensis TaxID=2599401 RepID=A0A5B8IR34_9ACTN|nr:acyl-CoA dehydrogenase family protein [Streptomyces qinzhouensis]QDY81002.1 acyl-CoA dehydrogenase [Streptomyces qinzhouensis]